MRLIRLLLVLSVVLIAPIHAQQPVALSPADALGFDYRDVDLSGYAVSGFEVNFDNGPWQPLGIPASVILPDTIPGGRTYKVLSPFVSGTHTVAFRACNSAGCGGPSVPFAYEHVNSPSASPGNVRKVPR
jgi:hypothetical protein